MDEKYHRKLWRVHLLEIDDGSAATVDLSPILFAKVLQYLRTNNTIYVSTSIALAELKEECRFFDLDESAIKVPCQRVRTFPLQHSVPAALRGTSRVHSPRSSIAFPRRAAKIATTQMLFHPLHDIGPRSAVQE